MFLRPNMYTSYEQEAQMLPTYTKKVLAGLAIIVLFLIPFDIPLFTAPTDLPILRSIPIISNGIPSLRFLGDSSWLRAMDEVLIFAVAALGLNILTGIGRPGVARPRVLHGCRCLHAAPCSAGVPRRTVWGYEPADLDLAAGRRRRRSARRHHRLARRGEAPRALPGDRHARSRVRGHPHVEHDLGQAHRR